MKEYVKFYGVNDWASSSELEKAISKIESFSLEKEYTDVNQVIELYNIKEYFDNEMFLPSWDDKIKSRYITIVDQFLKIIGKFFARINGTNICEYYRSSDFDYHMDFWTLVEYFGVYKRITSQECVKILKEKNILNNILSCPKIVKAFGKEIASELTANIQYAEIILGYYAVEDYGNRKKIYIPDELTTENKIAILQNYIDWERAHPNYLNLISYIKRCDALPINDRIRYAAHQKYNAYWNDKEKTVNMTWQEFSTCVSFYDDSKENAHDEPSQNKATVELTYGTSWIKENLDYPTLLNNFIYLFNFVDEQFRYQHVSNISKLGVLERTFGVTGRNDYRTGIEYQVNRMASIGQMTGYLGQLQTHNIRIEDVFKWFFETYLHEEFNVKGFVYFTPNEQASWIEKILVLITQFDSVIKQFRYYIEDYQVNREFFEFSSDQYKLSDSPSMIAEKYIYPQSTKILSAMNMFYSDQSMLFYVDKDSKYNNLPHLLLERKMKIEDFKAYNQSRVEWLIKEGFVYIDDYGYVKTKTEIAYLLKDLFMNGVISYHYYKTNFPFIVNKITEWIENGDLVSKQSLFTTQEQEFIDYILNVQKFDNGPELRNKYAHGIFPMDIKKQEQDYMELLRIMVLIIIKINEEFCILNPQ